MVWMSFQESVREVRQRTSSTDRYLSYRTRGNVGCFLRPMAGIRPGASGSVPGERRWRPAEPGTVATKGPRDQGIKGPSVQASRRPTHRSEVGAPPAQTCHQLPRPVLVQTQGGSGLLGGRVLPGIVGRPVPDPYSGHLQPTGCPNGRQR